MKLYDWIMKINDWNVISDDRIMKIISTQLYKVSKFYSRSGAARPAAAGRSGTALISAAEKH
ncbi:MAG: hypothetical protein ABIK30_17025 [bacterium]